MKGRKRREEKVKERRKSLRRRISEGNLMKVSRIFGRRERRGKIEKRVKRESGREDEHDGTERPSTSTRSSGKTHRDLYEERKKKSLRRKIESSKQRRNVAQDARKKRHAVKGVRSDMRETRCSSVDSEASSIDGGDDRFFFTSRPRNASRDGSVVPSVGGSRSGSREGSVAGSREGSPERDYVAHHAIDPGALAEKMRNDEKLKNRLIIEKMKEEDERERLRIEREKEKARKQKATGNPTPINPDEKIRAKPKVAMRSGRDPGILDGPASLHSVNRSVPLKTKGGTARKGPLPRPIQMGKRPSTQSLDPLDAIQIEMNQPLPSAPTISGKPISATPTPTTTTSTSTTPTPTPTVTARINYVNPTQDRMYAPDSDGVREERMTRRIEYGRANVIEEPLPFTIRDSMMDPRLLVDLLRPFQWIELIQSNPFKSFNLLPISIHSTQWRLHLPSPVHPVLNLD
ncbi:hypothetical protein PENTCL1PPCAC_11720 [Pristionchus entomophagus]|uniref:Uncharacterized protein n=1 Tax=Pristionchus entomophagus TaxID=358040 RepID=A0AAV5T384_9BILA|nr:hypothetical protein PENTCL1PPCAC_11720 [Pristionchus entomophagus]